MKLVLFRLAVLLVVGILVYNYFFGTPEEQAKSKEVGSKVYDLGKSAWDLLKSEKEKFDEGKYDDALDKVSGLFDDLKQKAETLEDNKDLLDRIADLERQRDAIDRELSSDGVSSYDKVGEQSEEDAEQMKKRFDDLLKDTEILMRDMEKQ